MRLRNWPASWVALGIFCGVSGTELLGAVPITALAFSPDGSVLVSSGDQGVDIRSPTNAQIQRRIACDLPKITSLAFAPQGHLLAVGGGEAGVRGEVLLFTWPEGKLRHRVGDHSDLVMSVAFDESGGQLGVGANDHTAQVWQIDGDAEPVLAFTLTGHVGPVLAVAFSPSGQSLVTASADRSLKVWSSAEGQLLRTLSHHTEAIHALAFRPRSTNDTAQVICASAGDDRTVRVWQPEIGRLVRTIRQHERPALALAWSADGSAIYSAGEEGIIRRIDGASDTVLAQWQGHEDWIYALALSPDGSVLASGDWSGNVRLHNVQRSPAPSTESGGGDVELRVER